jgi:hypothetical protein
VGDRRALQIKNRVAQTISHAPDLAVTALLKNHLKKGLLPFATQQSDLSRAG